MFLHFSISTMIVPIFQSDWTGACWGRWAGLELLLGWSPGSTVAFPCKNKKKDGSAGGSSVTAPMPKSVPS